MKKETTFFWKVELMEDEKLPSSRDSDEETIEMRSGHTTQSLRAGWSQGVVSEEENRAELENVSCGLPSSIESGIAAAKLAAAAHSEMNVLQAGFEPQHLRGAFQHGWL